MKKGLIIASGNIEDKNLILEESSKHDLVICVDGGIKHVYQLNIKIDGAIGDFDSVDTSFQKFVADKNIPTIEFPIEKDETDTQLAINYLIEKNCSEITFLGSIGTRMDHTMANILLLKSLYDRRIRGRIIDDHNKIYFTGKYLKLRKNRDSFISIIPITNQGAIVTLKGFYYNLDEERIEFASTLGISNIITDDFGEIYISEGEVLVFESRD